MHSKKEDEYLWAKEKRMKMIKKETKLVERLLARVRLHLLKKKYSYKQVTSMHSKKKR